MWKIEGEGMHHGRLVRVVRYFLVEIACFQSHTYFWHVNHEVVVVIISIYLRDCNHLLQYNSQGKPANGFPDTIHMAQFTREACSRTE